MSVTPLETSGDNGGFAAHLDPVMLEALDKKRVATGRRMDVFVIVMLFIFVALLMLIAENAEGGEDAFSLLIFAAFIMGFIFLIGRAVITSGYVASFKTEVVKPIIEGIDETIQYRPEQQIPRFVFDKSLLFGRYNKYQGEDFIGGTIDGVTFTLSELYVYDERKHNNNTVIVDIFHGTFAVFDFNKHFEQPLLIYPDVAEKHFGHFGTWLQSMNITKDKLFKLDHPEFEKHFVVYGKDPIEARYLLTHSMMERIVALRERVGVPVYLSFAGSKLYIGFEYGDMGQFEPDLGASLRDDARMSAYFDKIGVILGVANALELNRFLWSKEAPEMATAPKAASRAEPAAALADSGPVLQTAPLPDRADELSDASVSEAVPTQPPEPDLPAVDDDAVYDDYYREVAGALAPLERERIATLLAQIVITLLLGGGYAVISFNLMEQGSASGEGVGIIGIIVLIAILFGVAAIGIRYGDSYKNRLMKALFAKLNDALTYDPNRRMVQERVHESRLFKDWGRFGGDDLIEGKIAGADVMGSDLSIGIEEKDIFQGYFLIFDFDAAFDWDLRIFPAGKSFDALGGEEIPHPEGMLSRDWRFLRDHCEVYGNQRDAETLLRPEVIEKFMVFYRELRATELYVSFQGNKLYFGASFNGETFFDAKTTRSVYDEARIRFYIAFFGAVEAYAHAVLKASRS